MTKYKKKLSLNENKVLCKADVQLLEGQAGGVVCVIGADQTLCQEAQVVVKASVKPGVDL